MATKEKEIYIEAPKFLLATVDIEGDGELILNKMNARNERTLKDRDGNKKKIREIPNKWEDLVTAIHWRDNLTFEDTYKEITEESFEQLLKENAPCISAFGLKKSWGQAVVRNGIDTYATKFDNAVNIIADRNLIPITFATYSYEDRLMSPQKGSPVMVYLNHFGGWKASFTIRYTENIFNLQSIINIINLAGFGLGIGSGRTSGYGRYHVTNVRNA